MHFHMLYSSDFSNKGLFVYLFMYTLCNLHQYMYQNDIQGKIQIESQLCDFGAVIHI